MESSSIILSILRSGLTTDNYYKSMNEALMRLDDSYTMLHYPYFRNIGESFYDSQKNLTDYCLSQLPEVKGKTVCEIGCGNGLQAIYIQENHYPDQIIGIDLNPANIKIARRESQNKKLKNLKFLVADAQNLSCIEDNSIDIVINIESAFHYPDKKAFLKEMKRILKPGGHFLIADILTNPARSNYFRRFWKKKMHYNHWPLERYEKELTNLNLESSSCSDITPSVILGFQGYKHWLKNMRRGNLQEDFFLKLFYRINARLNIKLLKTRRKYFVFVGKKLSMQTSVA